MPSLPELEGELSEAWLKLSHGLGDPIRLSQFVSREGLFVTITECVHVRVFVNQGWLLCELLQCKI